MAVYKRGKTWWYKFCWRGERIYESAKTHNKREAETIQAARKTQLARAEVGLKDRAPAPTLARFAAERFIPHIEANKSEKPRTVAFYKNSIRNLLAFEPLAHARLDEINSALMDAFIETRRERDLETSTINRDLAGLRRLLRFAASDDVNVIARAPKVTLLNGENRRERVLTGAEEDVYLKASAQLVRDFAILSLDLGLRPEEVHRLEFAQFRDGAVRIYTGKRPASFSEESLIEAGLSRPRRVFPRFSNGGAQRWMARGFSPTLRPPGTSRKSPCGRSMPPRLKPVE